MQAQTGHPFPTGGPSSRHPSPAASEEPPKDEVDATRLMKQHVPHMASLSPDTHTHKSTTRHRTMQAPYRWQWAACSRPRTGSTACSECSCPSHSLDGTTPLSLSSQFRKLPWNLLRGCPLSNVFVALPSGGLTCCTSYVQLFSSTTRELASHLEGTNALIWVHQAAGDRETSDRERTALWQVLTHALDNDSHTCLLVSVLID